MDQNLLSLIVFVAIFLAYLVVRQFVLKRRKSKLDNNLQSNKMNMIVNIIHIILILCLLVFFWVGLIQRWNDGIHNYFNLILLIILTILSFIRFLKLNFRNKN